MWQNLKISSARRLKQEDHCRPKALWAAHTVRPVLKHQKKEERGKGLERETTLFPLVVRA